jgi:transcriptional regulator with XRE-family HTH domain
MVDDEVCQAARLLEALTKVRKVSTPRLERKLGLEGGTLNEIFSGRIELELRHVLGVLKALRVEPLRFFCQAFEEPTAVADAAWILEAVKDLTKRGSPSAMDRSAAEIQRLLFEMLHEQGLLPPVPPEDTAEPP